MKKLTFNESFFKNENPTSFYWAGFLAADGCINYRKAKVGNGKNGQPLYSDRYNISISQLDAEHIKLFLRHIESEPRKLSERKYWNETQKSYKILYTATLSSEIMFNDLFKYGLCERKSYGLIFPDWLKTHKFVSHFLRGYFDGDGSVYIYRGAVWIEFVGTQSFIGVVSDILSGVSGSKAKPYIVNTNTSRLVYSRKMASSIASFLYQEADVFLTRKRELIMRHNAA